MTSEKESTDRILAINELARRRGFYWQSYEIYGGVGGFVTYGMLGAKLKQNIEKKLRDLFVNELGIMEIESPVIAPSEVFEASGHVRSFKEPMIECKKCRKKYRADHLLRESVRISQTELEKLELKELGQAIERHQVHCPECGGSFAEPKQFLTMFKTVIGPYSKSIGYGRPEAAQGIFVEFNRLYGLARDKLPFGVMQIGRALRNEISPRQGLIRLREFTIADLEFFFDPEEPNCYLLKDVENEKLRLLLAVNKQRISDHITEVTVKEALEKRIIMSEWQAVFMALAKKLLIDLGVPAEKQRFTEKNSWERAHYSSQSFDQEVQVQRWGWVEVSGHAYRTDYDLKSHMERSGVDMYAFKKHGEPIEKDQLIIKPKAAKLGPILKEETAKVTELLSKIDVEEFEASIERKGYFMLGKYKILPDQIDIVRQKVVERGRRFVPHVVEPSFGSDRLFFVALEYAYCVKENRVILALPRNLVPTQIGVYPLMNKDDLPEKAMEVYRTLVSNGFVSMYDDTGSIGRRYARADEIGVQLGITVDYDTLVDDTVTIRDRDSWKQVRSQISDLVELFHRYFKLEIDFEQLGIAT